MKKLGDGAGRGDQPESAVGNEPPVGEWTIAALAHATVCLTVTLMMAGGIGLVVGPVAALAIHLAYRARSRYVALHALQSIAYQVAGAISLSLLGAAGIAIVVASWGFGGVFSAGPLGAVLRLFAVPFSLVVAAGLSGATVIWLAYGVYAASQVYQGRDFRYWLIGDWIVGEVGR